MISHHVRQYLLFVQLGSLCPFTLRDELFQLYIPCKPALSRVGGVVKGFDQVRQVTQ
jgi:hypothetical protein